MAARSPLSKIPAQDLGIPKLLHRGQILLGGFALSFSGLILRQIETADAWQIVFYRSGFMALGLALYLLWRTRGRLVAILVAAGAAGLLGGLALGVAMIGFVWAMTHTTVANTLFMFAASPFFAAVLGLVLLGERVRARTWTTMVIAALGIAIMVGGGIVLGHLPGMLAALIASVAAACFTIVVRWRRDINLMPSVLYAAVLSSAFGAMMSAGSGSGYTIPLADLLWCLAYGGPLTLLGLALYVHGSRFVPAAEVALLGLVEVALGPLWVWLVIDETPSQATLIGGAVVLAAVVAQILLGGRPRNPPAPLD